MFYLYKAKQRQIITKFKEFLVNCETLSSKFARFEFLFGPSSNMSSYFSLKIQMRINFCNVRRQLGLFGVGQLFESSKNVLKHSEDVRKSVL